MKGDEDTLKLLVVLKSLDEKLMNHTINIQHVKFESKEDPNNIKLQDEIYKLWILI